MADDVQAVLAKYMSMLDMGDLVPEISIRDNLGASWLGRTTLKKRREGTEISVEVQASIASDQGTLEKVLAHEAIHCVEFATMAPHELALARLGRLRAPAHGRRFHELAAIINDAMGPDFVTEESDQSYEVAENDRPFTVLIEELPGSRLGWSWAVKLTPAISEIIERKLARGAVVVKTTERALTSGAKIRKSEMGRSLAKVGSDVEDMLRDLYEAAK